MKHHQTLRRGLGILILMLMCLTLLPMAALAEEISWETADFTNIFSRAEALELLGGTDKATWDNETKTLTLKGVNFATSAEVAVNLPADTTIVLAEGTTNIITGVSPWGSSSEGICANGNLTIRGSGTLTVTGGSMEEYECLSCGICAYNGDITISEGTVTAIGGAALGSNSESYGIYAARGNVIINGGTVTAGGGTANSCSCGIYAGDVTISGGTAITEGGKTDGEKASDYSDSYGIFACRVAVSGGSVNAAGGTANSWSCGICAYTGDITITGGTVTATGGTASFESYGIHAENMTISNSTVTAAGGTADSYSYGISVYKKLTVSENSTCVTATGGEAGENSYGIRAKNMTVSVGGADIGGESGKSYGIHIDSDLPVTNGTVEAVGGASTGESGKSYGIYAYDVTIYGGHLIARTDENTAMKSALSAEPNLSSDMDYCWRTDEKDPFTLSTTAEYSYSASHTYVEITDRYPYTITVKSVENGIVTADSETAVKGTAVSLTVTPDKGYALETLTVLDKNGKEITLTKKSDTLYTFTMPASNVTVKAAFAEIKIENPFTDVPADAYYYDAVLWAVGQGITVGVDDTHFAPDAACTRAQAVTFLWRDQGSPKPASRTMPFTDVAAGTYYYDAVLWAVENGITFGTGDTTFSPNAECTRAQSVTFLWRDQGCPKPASLTMPFSDVAADAYYYDAVLWAAENGITKGTSDTTFSPDSDCTRAQIVTFLYRCLG